VGEMATWVQGSDPPLGMDIAAVARTVSRHVITCGGEGGAASYAG
jgi:hypothetical protein